MSNLILTIKNFANTLVTYAGNFKHNVKLVWNNEYAVLVQQYMCQDPTYTLYKRNSIFGKYNICLVKIDNCLKSTFYTPTELIDAIKIDIKKSNFCQELELKNDIYEEVEKIFNTSTVHIYIHDMHDKRIYDDTVYLTKLEKLFILLNSRNLTICTNNN